MNEKQIERRLNELCRLKHLALATERSYAGWVRSYIKALDSVPRSCDSERKVEAFLTGLAQRGVAAATQNQALNALNFLYREILAKPLGNEAIHRGHREPAWEPVEKVMRTLL